MATTTVKRRREVVNPAFRKSRQQAQGRKPASRTRRNVGEIITVGALLNPAGKERKVARKTKSNSAARSSRPHRQTSGRSARNTTRGAVKKNPATPGPVRRRRGGYKRNPAGLGVFADAGYALVGAIGSRFMTQFVLGARNKGVTGYLTNGAVSLGLYFGTKHVVKNERGADMILLGSTIGILLRAMQDFTPFGQYAQLAGMGDYAATTFFVPAIPRDPQSGTSGDVELPAQIMSELNSTKQALLASANAAKQGRQGGGVGSVADGIGGRYSTKGRYN